jgi:hypothetical protein
MLIIVLKYTQIECLAMNLVFRNFKDVKLTLGKSMFMNKAQRQPNFAR